MYWPVLNFGSSLFCITEYELFIKIFPTTTWALVDLLLPPAASSSTIAGLRFYVTPKICQTVKNNWCTSFSLFIYSLFTFHFSLPSHPLHQLHPSIHPTLSKNILHVGPYRIHAQKMLFCNLPIGHAGEQVGQHFHFFGA